MAIYKIRLKLELNSGDDRVYTVTSPDMPGLVTEGSTPEEIGQNVQEALDCLVEVFNAQGWELPPSLHSEKAIPVEKITMLQVAVAA